MDHLLKPHEPLSQFDEASLLTRAGYDHVLDGFIEYPDRDGWHPRPADAWRNIFTSKDPEFLAFLQRWLFFGLLECTLGMEVDVETFTKGGQYLSTKNLLRVVSDSRVMPTDGHHVRATLKHAASIHLRLFTRRSVPATPDTGLATKISLTDFIDKVPKVDPRDSANVTATSLLLEYLHNFVGHLWDGHLQPSVNHPKLTEPSTGPSWNALQTNGWCPSEAAAIVDRFGASGVYFLTRIRPPSPERHRVRGSCSHIKCRLRQLNDATTKLSMLRNAMASVDTLAQIPRLLHRS
jgi:hypothetical protein